MTGLTKALIVLFLLIFAPFAAVVSGAASPQDQAVKQQRSDFLKNYGFFVTKDEKKILNACKTTECVDSFSEKFWLKRDLDPNTPENEYKEIIDRRIQDIQNEIFMTDPDMFGTKFSESGGLTGEMAHVYLFYGTPHYMKKLRGDMIIADMAVWYYFDDEGYPLFRFLFLSKNNKSYYLYTMYSLPIEVRLEEISVQIVPILNRSDPDSVDAYSRELEKIIAELRRKDPMGIFQAAIMEFSYYPDITIAKALQAPDPTGLVSGSRKPTEVIGLPAVTKDQQFIFSPYHSLVPANFQIVADSSSGKPSLSLLVGYSGVDWEIKGDKVECIMHLRLSFQNKATKKITEFATNVVIGGSLDAVKANMDKYFVIDFTEFQNSESKDASAATMRALIQGLERGEYVLNLYLKNVYTMKYFASQNEVTIK